VTIHPHHIPDLERLSQYMQPPMLMLGAHGSAIPGFKTAGEYFAQWVGGKYFEVDLDGGHWRRDLNEDLRFPTCYGTVFNLGTIEHVWNVHNAWVNALRAVEVGGHFLNHSPVAGYRNHGLHITSEPAIRAFVSKNGFNILDAWITYRAVGDTLWLAAVKERHIEDLADFEPAWQVYEEGQKKAVR